MHNFPHCCLCGQLTGSQLTFFRSGQRIRQQSHFNISIVNIRVFPPSHFPAQYWACCGFIRVVMANAAIFLRQMSLLLQLSLSLLASAIPPCIFFLCILSFLASQPFNSQHPFLICLMTRHSTLICAKNSRNLHWSVCCSSGLKDCGQVS